MKKSRLMWLVYVLAISFTYSNQLIAATFNIDLGTPSSADGFSTYGGDASVGDGVLWNAASALEEPTAITDTNDISYGTTLQIRSPGGGDSDINNSGGIAPPSNRLQLTDDGIFAGLTSRWELNFDSLPSGRYDVYIYSFSSNFETGPLTLISGVNINDLSGVNNGESVIVTDFLVDDGALTVSGACPSFSCGISGLQLVSTVPIPASVWLFGSGLLGLVGIARCKKAA